MLYAQAMDAAFEVRCMTHQQSHAVRIVNAGNAGSCCEMFRCVKRLLAAQAIGIASSFLPFRLDLLRYVSQNSQRRVWEGASCPELAMILRHSCSCFTISELPNSKDDDPHILGVAVFSVAAMPLVTSTRPLTSRSRRLVSWR